MQITDFCIDMYCMSAHIFPYQLSQGLTSHSDILKAIVTRAVEVISLHCCKHSSLMLVPDEKNEWVLM